MAELSIIVPIYNVEKYLERCIESILAQTYKDFELILVNDGSPDNCAEIMEQYAKKDNRIITIHQENKGVSAARNAGLNISSGKYVGFVDADDWIDSEIYEKLIIRIQASGAELACCNWCVEFEDGKKHVHQVNEINEEMSQGEFVKHIFESPRTVGGSVCNKLFLRGKIFESFDETKKICEDNLFLMQYCLNVRNVTYIYEPLYTIFERKNSATRENNQAVALGLTAREALINMAGRICKSAKKMAEKDFLDSCYFCCEEMGKKDKSEYTIMAEEHFCKYIKENLGSVLFNSEIYWKTKVLYLKKLIFK